MSASKKQFSLVRVATKNIVTDSFQGLRNLFGLRLRGYEKMLQQNIKELTEEAFITYPNILWYRMSINPLVKGAAMITIYGEYQDE